MRSVLRGYQSVIMLAALQHRVQMTPRAPQTEDMSCVTCLTALFAFTVIDSFQACFKEAAGVICWEQWRLVTPGFPPETPRSLLIQSGAFRTWAKWLTPPTRGRRAGMLGPPNTPPPPRSCWQTLTLFYLNFMHVGCINVSNRSFPTTFEIEWKKFPQNVCNCCWVVGQLGGATF